nr:thioredoxin family protein [Sphingomonas kyeonggiensis]
MVVLDDASFDGVVRSHPVVLVHFAADWSRPSQLLSPVIRQIAQERDDALICQVNVDTSPLATSPFMIRNVPTLIFLKQGTVVLRHVGMAQHNVVTAMLNSLV